MISLATLQLLKRVLDAQQLSVGDPEFSATAQAAMIAQKELDDAIAAEQGTNG